MARDHLWTDGLVVYTFFINVLAIHVLATGFTADAYAENTLPLPQDVLDAREFKVGLGGGYLKTRSNYDRDGEKEDLNASSSFQSIRGTAFFQYGATNEFTLFSNIDFVFQSTTGTSTTDRAVITNTESGPGDAEIGARYLAYRNPIRIFVDGTIQFPLYSRATGNTWASLDSNTGVPHGNGTSAFGLLGTAELPLSTDFYFGASVGYTSRSSGFSNLLPYKAYVRYQERRAFFGRIGFLGQASASDDGFATAAAASERAQAAVARSQALNAINPAFLKVDFALGTYLGRSTFLYGGLQYPLIGRSIPQEATFTAAIGLALGSNSQGDEYTHSKRGFQEYYFTSKVIKANNQLQQILINKGANAGVIVGEYMDLFERDLSPGTFGETVGRGQVIETGPTRSKIKILEYYKQVPVKEGFVVRRPVR